jgi:hypothetical protein
MKNELETLIKRSNARFKRATRAQKRVLIAKDSLLQIEKGRFFPSRGTYLNLFSLMAQEASFQKSFLANSEISCAGCALGALFISTTILANRATVAQTCSEGGLIGHMLKDSSVFSNHFDKYFSRKQLALIEYTFELGLGSFNGFNLEQMGHDSKTIGRADYFKIERNEEERLVAILKNIIKNRGTFKP